MPDWRRTAAFWQLFPCPVCGTGDGAGCHAICTDCREQFGWIAGARCRGCGGALDGVLGVCSKCMRERGVRPWQYALALFDYRGVGRDTVRAFKFYDRPELARSFAELAVPVLRECGEPVDLLIPVPLHWTRAWRRGYNQAALFAGECARQLGVESLPLLRRTRPTPHQAGGSREARLKNLQGAFAVRHPERLRGRSVWLVDDVLTTGSTLTAAAQALSEAGVREMRILVIARA